VSANEPRAVDENELARIAEDAYAYFFPIVLMDITRRLASNVPPGTRPGFGPMNHFVHVPAFPPGNFRDVVRPNYDTLYSILWFDVRDEPLVISVPDTGGRYYMVPMLDMWTDVFAVVGSRTTGTGEGHYAVASPGWNGDLPEGVGRIDAPTPYGWVIGRTQTNGPADYPAVHAIQAGITASPLSRWPNAPADAVYNPDPSFDTATDPLGQVLAMSGSEFLRYGVELLQLNPPHLTDQPILARMAALGVQPGRPFDPNAVSPAVAAAIDAAPAAANQHMAEALPLINPVVNGWTVGRSAMGVYGTDYLRRAIVAKMGLGANLPDDAVYPILIADASGTPPDGANDYVLHFDAGKLPPAGAFWSVTMYDGEGFPVPNAIDRYAIGDRDDLRFNADGSLDLYLQHDDPGGEKHANWLPAPRGPIGVTMRIYDPAPEVLDGRWGPPPLNRAG
jgi:hypothetical protein